MRDPELMQRADRAAVSLEQAWERWRAMHGLGAEPLPPVSSYVGYSLEEPWGQPRVVFGLRADEAELLATLLDGHDCVGPIYAEVSARPDWRHQVNGPATPSSRPYGDSLSVPAQAPPPAVDQVGSPGYAPRRAPEEEPDAEHEDQPGPADARESGGARRSGGARTSASRDRRSARRSADEDAAADEPADGGEAEWPGPDDEPDGAGVAADRALSPPLAPLPDLADVGRDQEDEDSDDGTATPSGPVVVPAQGPGYRGPRYQGFPPRYDPGREPATQVADGDETAEDAEPETARRSPVTKLSRGSRRRTSRS